MPTDKLDKFLKHYPEVTGVHPACLAVPSIDTDDFDALCNSVSETGLRHEILLTKDGLLIDGRNRLHACFLGKVEPRFKYIATDPWEVAYAENIAHRHLSTGQKAMFGANWKAYEAEEAKKRQVRKPESVVATLPQQKGKARDKAGSRVGVGGKAIDKACDIIANAPDLAAKVNSNELTLEAAYTENKQRKQDKKSDPIEEPVKVKAIETTTIVTANGVESQIALPHKVVFNQTNDSVDWANWTWNPVTGCEHGCKFCYAREIANSQRMQAFYPNGFEPTYHEYRLAAPKNTSCPDSKDERDKRVFVCSMADLFGKWVPDTWIKAVFESCLESPKWTYLFLTKWPARYAKMPLIEDAWYGSSVIQQSDVARVEKAMQQFTGAKVTRWISLEPMLGPIEFNDLSWCDLVVIGSQTSTNQPDGFVPAFAPEFDWIVDVVNQCREFGVPYYLKANLGMDRPGMNLPKSMPRPLR